MEIAVRNARRSSATITNKEESVMKHVHLKPSQIPTKNVNHVYPTVTNVTMVPPAPPVTVPSDCYPPPLNVHLIVHLASPTRAP